MQFFFSECFLTDVPGFPTEKKISYLKLGDEITLRRIIPEKILSSLPCPV